MHILVIGAGAIGFQLSKQLSQDGHDITQIDTDPSRVKRVSEQLDIIVAEGNGTSLQDLRGIGIEQVDLVAAMTTNDEVNLLACRMAKKLGVESTIARIRNPEFAAPDFIFSPQELGVDQFIHPEKETADAIVRLIRQSSATDLVEFAEGKLVLLGMRLDHQSSLLHAPLAELGRQFADIPMRIVAIQRKQQTLIPSGNTKLLPEDRIFVISDPDYIPSVISLTGLADRRIEDIVILGGGLIGQFVAQELASQMRIKLIESQADRSPGKSPINSPTCWSSRATARTTICWPSRASPTWTPSSPLPATTRSTSSRRWSPSTSKCRAPSPWSTTSITCPSPQPSA